MMALRRLVKHLARPLRNHRGVALLMAIFATTMMIFLAVDVSYDTSIEYLVASQQVHRLKAYYAAKAGVEISLLRVLIYKKAMSQFGSQLKGNENMLDPVWKMPFSWPPVLPDDLSAVDKDLIQSVVEESTIEGQFIATIESEGGKIDINDLGSKIESLRKSTRQQLLLIFETEMRNNEEFADRNFGADFNEVLNNITDWIDEDTESIVGGGPESGLYTELENREFIRPNTPLKTVEELNMIAGMKPEYYDLLAPRVTVFGVKGVNVNYAPKEIIMGLAPTMTEEAANEVLARRDNLDQGGPFVDENDFFGFLQSQRVDTQPIEDSKIPLYFDAVYNFRIKSTGAYANVTREVEAVVYDFENMKERYIEMVNKEEDDKTGGESGPGGSSGREEEDKDSGEDGRPPGTPSPGSGGSETGPKVPNGRPRVVYWKEN